MIKIDLEQTLVPMESRISDRALELLAHQINENIQDFDGLISARFVNDSEIRELNRMYRKNDTVTDVLSFGYSKEQNGRLLGDIVISFEQACRQADGDVELELIDLLTHGVLHVLGHDHERPEDAKLMFPLQDKIINYVVSQKVL